MAQLLTPEQLKAFFDTWKIKLDSFADEEDRGFSSDLVKDKLNKETRMTVQYQQLFLKRMEELGEQELFKEPNLDDKDYWEKTNERWDKKAVFNPKAVLQNQKWEELKYTCILGFIENAPVNILSNYWDNFEDIYSKIDVKASSFLVSCLSLAPHISRKDCRPELLAYMQTFSSEVGKMQEALNAMHFIFNREQIFSKNEVNYKKSKRFHCKDDPKVVEAYRTELVKKCEKLFFETEDSEIGDIICFQVPIPFSKNGEEHWIPGFITRMDELHWNLLSAYLLVRADDENGEKLALIQEKLDALEKENRN